MLSQILKLIKLVGLRKAARMKKHHEQGLAYIRGYATTCCWWTLLNNGFLDQLNENGMIQLGQYKNNNKQDPNVLDAIIEYLHGTGLLERSHDEIRLSEKGKVLLAEPRGMFELLWAYEPCFSQLPDLLTKTKQYGNDLTRRITYVGLGSGRLCEQLPYPVMRRMILEYGCRMVLDLGCGDMALLAGLCRLNPDIRGHGVDFSEDMVKYDQDLLAKNNYNDRLTVQRADIFDLPFLPRDLPPIDCITACDTFHEYLGDEQLIITLLQNFKNRFPDALFVVGEFCLQNPTWLRKHPTASLEHHLFHQLSNQQIGSAQQWRDIFAKAGMTIIEEQIYDLIGHGYFALK
jgi:hypothetical protein